MAASDAKQRILEESLLPRAVALGDTCYPRLKRNKRMKVLTLTNESNWTEINALKNNKLTTNDDIFGWTSSISRRARLETCVPIKFMGSGRFEDYVSANGSALADFFPFDVLNLDFNSQYTENYAGRLVKEIIALELVLRLQKHCIVSNK